MPSKKASRKPRATKQEIELAEELQAPRRGRKAGVSLPSVMDFGTLKKDARALRGDDDETNWIPSANLIGEPFYIVKAFTFETVNDGKTNSKVGFEIAFNANDQVSAGCFSMPWNEERDSIVKAFKAHQKRVKGLKTGPVMLAISEPTVSGHKPYKRLVQYSEELAAESRALLQAMEAPTVKRGRKAKAKASNEDPNEF